MTRTYTLKKRAEQKADTRRRIVEAAIDLHGRHGPAATTFKMVADEAGVQRHTLYAHFPDEMSLYLACSGMHLDNHPPPEPARWSGLATLPERIETALSEIYAWYSVNPDLIASVLRDAEHHPTTQEVVRLRIAPHLVAWRRSLGVETVSAERAAMIDLALSFQTWRTLVREGALASAAAARTMTAAIMSAP